MKTTIAFFLLTCLPMLLLGHDERQVEGAWLRDGVEWTKAPEGMNPHLKLGDAQILYFGKDHTFLIIYCVIYRAPKQGEVISHGDPRDVYLGKWEVRGDDIIVKYRLVGRTVRIKGEELPGPVQHSSIKVSRDILYLEKNSFRRAEGLDKDAAEVMAGLQNTSMTR